MVTLSPTPGRPSRSTRPPWAATMLWTIARPSPVPLPCSLVVKKGSATRASNSSSIPGPSSATTSRSGPVPGRTRRRARRSRDQARRKHRSPGVHDRVHGVHEQVQEGLAELVRRAADVRHGFEERARFRPAGVLPFAAALEQQLDRPRPRRGGARGRSRRAGGGRGPRRRGSLRGARGAAAAPPSPPCASARRSRGRGTRPGARP